MSPAFGDPVIANPHSFWEEARYQMVCANPACGAPGHFHAHHVVDKQTLRRYGVGGNSLYDTRNALRLCAGIDGAQCHMRFEGGGVRKLQLPTGALLDCNILYAFDILGAWASDFLRRDYDDTLEDPRILELELAVR